MTFEPQPQTLATISAVCPCNSAEQHPAGRIRCRFWSAGRHHQLAHHDTQQSQGDGLEPF